MHATVDCFGGLDAVCLNAGLPVGTMIGDDFDPGRYRYGMQVNLDGAVYGMNAALPQLRGRGGGAILFTSSLAGIAPATDPYYCAAKHALIGLARSLALLLQGDHVTVNAICPGFIDTRLITVVRDHLAAHGSVFAGADEVASVAAAVLDSTATGQAWEVQSGQSATPVRFPDVRLQRTAGRPTRKPEVNETRVLERRTS